MADLYHIRIRYFVNPDGRTLRMPVTGIEDMIYKARALFFWQVPRLKPRLFQTPEGKVFEFYVVGLDKLLYALKRFITGRLPIMEEPLPEYLRSGVPMNELKISPTGNHYTRHIPKVNPDGTEGWEKQTFKANDQPLRVSWLHSVS